MGTKAFFGERGDFWKAPQVCYRDGENEEFGWVASRSTPNVIVFVLSRHNQAFLIAFLICVFRSFRLQSFTIASIAINPALLYI